MSAHSQAVQTKQKSKECEALVKAIISQSLFELKKLLDAGYSPDGDDVSGHLQPMIKAIHTGQLIMVKTLLDYGASPDKYKALAEACSGSKIAILNELLYRGANPNIFQSGPPDEPLIQRMILNGKTEVVKLLIQYGASVNRCNLQTILGRERKNAGQVECIKLMLAQIQTIPRVHQKLYDEFIASYVTETKASSSSSSSQSYEQPKKEVITTEPTTSSSSSQSIAPSITSTNSYGKAPSPITTSTNSYINAPAPTQSCAFIRNIQNSSISQLSSDESQKKGIIVCGKTPSANQFFSAISTSSADRSYDYTPPPQLDKEIILHARVIATYKAQKSEELTVIKGDIVSVIERKPSGWWLCQYNGKQGFIPGNRLSLEEETPSASYSFSKRV